MNHFKLISAMTPKGDQPQAIEKLVKGFQAGKREQVLMGVTGSGKTFTMAQIIAKLGKPTLVISHNKTLAAQLYSELKDFFPENAVEYFVSYYDYYQPEAYIPHTDTYIEKDASINDDLDRLRLSATSSLLSRKDCVIVSSVSCIYGLGAPEDWQGLLITIAKGELAERDKFLSGLIGLQYERVDTELKRGSFRVRGGRVDLFPSYGENPYRIDFGTEAIERITLLDPVKFAAIREIDKLAVYPAKHFVTPTERLESALVSIEQEMKAQVRKLTGEGKDLEAKRLESRTLYDLEMLKEVGYCGGVENYSRHLSGRAPGSTPYSLIDYFPDDFLVIIDESHQSIPQIRGMYNGDASRKKVLVDHGFRLPSALDNRPLKFPEFENKIKQCLYVSATPGPYEMGRCPEVVEQVIRPTGLMDPVIEVRGTRGQIDDLIGEIRIRAKKSERTLVTTITKKMAEDLSRYLKDLGIKVSYIHSEFDAFERVEILRDLRLKKYDCVIGVNLLREGLDLPEVSLVAVLDADKEGFLRSDVSLIQIAGRAARHANGRVIMYAEKVTDSMRRAIDETARRRKVQEEYNRANGITPTGIIKEIREGIERWKKAEEFVHDVVHESKSEYQTKNYLAFLKTRMEAAARALEFDKAARYRDEIRKLESDKTEKENPRKGKRKAPGKKRSR
ncbi:MAG TPA: excinuclease ABC subunit UvrB [Candidatus Omnitrophota bacterium]|nr:excinuclease ABC subunit UvrB [Candidatus Omnitrophota bacterium]HQB12433.1 excinuclease ABC subunit UvrB [Candidatus Omnitrophota bacterium]